MRTQQPGNRAYSAHHKAVSLTANTEQQAQTALRYTMLASRELLAARQAGLIQPSACAHMDASLQLKKAELKQLIMRFQANTFFINSAAA